MIEIIPANIPNTAYCIAGYHRGLAYVDKQQRKWDKPLPLLGILEHMGVSDCMFSLGGVTYKHRSEAAYVVVQYMKFLFTLAVPYSSMDTALYELELKAIRKRCEGHNRPEPLRHARAITTALRRSEADPVAIFGLRSLTMLASVWPDHLAACHAGIELMNASTYNDNDADHMSQLLNNKLRELIV